MSPKITLLFLCTGNACRSQMAEGWARHLKGEILSAKSAGIEAHGLNKYAVKVMGDEGVDISSHTSKRLEDLTGEDFDYVITVCDHAHETCPWFPAKSKIIHVGFEDPPRLAEQFKSKEQKLDCYRKVRDEIKKYILTLPECLSNGE